MELALKHCVSGDEFPFSGELLDSLRPSALAFSFSHSIYQWACIIRGEFAGVDDTLRKAAAPERGLSVTVTDTHRGVAVYALVRTIDSRYETDIYLSVPSNETLVASPDPGVVRGMIDRHRDGGSLPQPLAEMVEDWGLPDNLTALPVEDYGGFVNVKGIPINETRVLSFHATFTGGSTATAYFLQQYEDEGQAAEAVAWLNAQTQPHWKKIGLGENTTIDQWRQKGSTVYGEIMLPDENLPNVGKIVAASYADAAAPAAR